MYITRFIQFIALSVALLLVASACSGLDSAGSRVSGIFGESDNDRFAERAGNSLARLDTSRASDFDIRFSDTVTLQQLHDAGIPVGSYQIDCDRPLHVVIAEGAFDRGDLFSTGASIAGGSLEGIAMRMVAQIYDPETDMPLGMIGDQTGGQLTNITGSSTPGSGIDGALILEPDDSTQAGALVPEAVCR